MSLANFILNTTTPQNFNDRVKKAVVGSFPKIGNPDVAGREVFNKLGEPGVTMNNYESMRSGASRQLVVWGVHQMGSQRIVGE